MRHLLAAVLIWLGFVTLAMAQQQNIIVDTCGTQNLPVGERGIGYMDKTGMTCTNASGGGGPLTNYATETGGNLATAATLLGTIDSNMSTTATNTGLPLPPRVGSVTQTAGSVGTSSGTLVAAAAFTFFGTVCVPGNYASATGIWVNWTGAAAVTAPPSQNILPGDCFTWKGASGYLPNQAWTAIAAVAGTVTVVGQ